MADLKTEGKFDQARGKVRETVGKVTGKKPMENKGKAERVKGKVKGILGDITGKRA